MTRAPRPSKGRRNSCSCAFQARCAATAVVLLTYPTQAGRGRCVARPPKSIPDGAMICSRRVSIFRRGLSTFPTECRAISACFSSGDSCRDRLSLVRSRSATAVYEEAASLSPYIPGRPTGAESECARAASPEAVEPSGELDARRSNIVHRKEKDRPGMRVRRAGNEDRDEAVAQRFGLNAELPSPFHRHEHNGKLANLSDLF